MKWLLVPAGSREMGYLGSLVPSPTPSFSSLLSTVLSSDEKLGVGLGTRLLFRDMAGAEYACCPLPKLQVCTS